MGEDPHLAGRRDLPDPTVGKIAGADRDVEVAVPVSAKLM
jgi:hypothetical protein